MTTNADLTANWNPSWIAFDLLLTLVFDDPVFLFPIQMFVVNCFRFIAYLGLWRPNRLWPSVRSGRELLSIYCLPWSLTTAPASNRNRSSRELLSIYCLPWSLTTLNPVKKNILQSWIAFDLLLTLVFDDLAKGCLLPAVVVNCFRFIAYLGLWRQLDIISLFDEVVNCFRFIAYLGLWRLCPMPGCGLCCRELLSIYCLPWSLTTIKIERMTHNGRELLSIYCLPWSLTTLVWILRSYPSRELLSIYCLPWSLTTVPYQVITTQ